MNLIPIILAILMLSGYGLSIKGVESYGDTESAYISTDENRIMLIQDTVAD